MTVRRPGGAQLNQLTAIRMSQVLCWEKKNYTNGTEIRLSACCSTVATAALLLAAQITATGRDIPIRGRRGRLDNTTSVN